MPTLFQLKSYLQYWLNAVTEHSLHSPFLYGFYSNVLKAKNTPALPAFENLHTQLKNNHSTITISDLGAGTRHASGTVRKVSSIASTSLSATTFSMLYSRIIHYYDLKNIVELGTSLGINTLYLAMHKNTHVSTFEGCPQTANIARSVFESTKATNITLHQGNIDTTLPAFLNTSPPLDFVFIDANHRYEPTLRYFQWLSKKAHAKTIIIIDDIHYTAEMTRAWNELKQSDKVYASIDIFRCGMLFFDPALNKQHVVLEY